MWILEREGSRVARRLFVLFGVAFLSLSALSLPAHASSDGLRKLPSRIAFDLPPDGTGAVQLEVDASLRRLHALIGTSQGSVLRSYDIDSLRLVVERRTQETLHQGLMLVDEEGGRILAPFSQIDPSTGLGNFAGVLVLDGRTLATRAAWPAPIGASSSGMGARPIIGSTHLYSPRTGIPKLYFLYQDEVTTKAFARLVSNPTFVSEWDAARGSGEASSGTPRWSYRVQGCRGDLPFETDFFRDPASPSIFIGCVTPENTGVSVKVTLDEQDAPLGEEAFPGPTLTNRVLADPSGRRLAFAVEKGGKESLFVFDGSRGAYVGAIATTSHRLDGISYAVDEDTGRLVAVTADRGLMLADLRRTPAQQALTFSSFARRDGAVIGVERATAGRPRRYFMRAAIDPFIEIFEDRVAISTDPPLSDFDRFTVDNPEKEGVTESSYESSAHAYGARTLIVGGLEGLGASESRRQFRRAGSPCSLYDRELVAGQVHEATLAKGSASASAVAADADKGTITDLQEPVSRCWANPDPFDTGQGFRSLGLEWMQPRRDFDENGELDETTGQKWPFEKIECSGDEEDETQDQTFGGYRADVDCAGLKGTTTAFSQASLDDAPYRFGFTPSASIRIGEAASRVSLEKAAKGGVVALAEAWTRNIDISGVGTIGFVYTIARSQAAGLPNTARGDFDRTICGVVIPRAYEQEGCEDPEEAVAALNRALGARGRAYLRHPDPNLKRGSPGGYLASVQKDRFEELSDRALNNDASTQVTGLELLLINDNIEFGRARQLFQFAGVDAQTTYGIFLLPTFDPLPPEPPVLPPVQLPPTTAVIEEPPPPAPPRPAPIVKTIVDRIRTGFALGGRNPKEAALATITWLVIGAPLMFAQRRRSLGRALMRRRTP